LRGYGLTGRRSAPRHHSIGCRPAAFFVRLAVLALDGTDHRAHQGLPALAKFLNTVNVDCAWGAGWPAERHHNHFGFRLLPVASSRCRNDQRIELRVYRGWHSLLQHRHLGAWCVRLDDGDGLVDIHTQTQTNDVRLHLRDRGASLRDEDHQEKEFGFHGFCIHFCAVNSVLRLRGRRFRNHG
jgi:hypothetical protein